MTRIVAGNLGGQTIIVPPKGTRPTSERVREALFSKLDHMGMCDGTRVMDIFAGSGALGIEALSRGAAHALFVEKAPAAARVITRNLSALKVGPAAQVTTGDALNYLTDKDGKLLGGDVDLVLIDPPYDLEIATVEAILAALGPWITPDALIVLEASSRAPMPALPDFLLHEETKKYGETVMYFLGPPPADSEAKNEAADADEGYEMQEVER